jgi:hypothetical protein
LDARGLKDWSNFMSEALKIVTADDAVLLKKPVSRVGELALNTMDDPSKLFDLLTDIDGLRAEIEERMRRAEEVKRARELLEDDAVRTDALNRKLEELGRAMAGANTELPVEEVQARGAELLHMAVREVLHEAFVDGRDGLSLSEESTLCAVQSDEREQSQDGLSAGLSLVAPEPVRETVSEAVTEPFFEPIVTVESAAEGELSIGPVIEAVIEAPVEAVIEPVIEAEAEFVMEAVIETAIEAVPMQEVEVAQRPAIEAAIEFAVEPAVETVIEASFETAIVPEETDCIPVGTVVEAVGEMGGNAGGEAGSEASLDVRPQAIPHVSPEVIREAVQEGIQEARDSFLAASQMVEQAELSWRQAELAAGHARQLLEESASEQVAARRIHEAAAADNQLVAADLQSAVGDFQLVRQESSEGYEAASKRLEAAERSWKEAHLAIAEAKRLLEQSISELVQARREDQNAGAEMQSLRQQLLVAHESANERSEEAARLWQQADQAVTESKRQWEGVMAAVAQARSHEETAATDLISARQELTTVYQFASVAAQRQRFAAEFFNKTTRWVVLSGAVSWVAVVWFGWFALRAHVPIWGAGIGTALVVAVTFFVWKKGVIAA